MKQELVIRAAMRPEIERRRGSDQWLGGPITAIIDMAGDYAFVVLPGRHCRRSASGSIICVRRSTPLIASATVRRSGGLVRVVDIGVADEAGELVAVGRATYATLV